jgi:hypothetical protein
MQSEQILSDSIPGIQDFPAWDEPGEPTELAECVPAPGEEEIHGGARSEGGQGASGGPDGGSGGPPAQPPAGPGDDQDDGDDPRRVVHELLGQIHAFLVLVSTPG